MGKIEEFDSLKAFNDVWGIDTKHPLVDVDGYDFNAAPAISSPYTANLYAVFLVGDLCIDHLVYGDGRYTLHKNSLIFLSPGQVIQYPNEGYGNMIKGRGLYFHPDLIRRSQLAQRICYHTFFDYNYTEGVRITAEEREIVNSYFDSISREIEHRDILSDNIIISNIALLLEHCARFCLRQAADKRDQVSSLVSEFEFLVNECFKRSASESLQIPPITWFAKECNYSTKHFIGLIKQHTGRTPHEYIQKKTIKYACVLLATSDIPIKGVSELLGFQHIQSFIKAFRRETGCAPSEYRQHRLLYHIGSGKE